MRIGASFKVSAGEEAVIAALIVPTVADGAVEKHIIAATGALVKADINAACPHIPIRVHSPDTAMAPLFALTVTS